MVGWGKNRSASTEKIDPTPTCTGNQQRPSAIVGRTDHVFKRPKYTTVDLVVLNRLRRSIRDTCRLPQTHSDPDFNNWKAVLHCVSHMGFLSWKTDFDWVFRILALGCSISAWQVTMAYASRTLEFDSTEACCTWVFRLLALGSSLDAWKEAQTFAVKNLRLDTVFELHECAFRFLSTARTLDDWKRALAFAAKFLHFDTMAERYNWTLRFLATNKDVDEWKLAASYVEAWNMNDHERRECVFRLLQIGCDRDVWDEAVEFSASLPLSLQEMLELAFSLARHGIDAYQTALAFCTESGFPLDHTWVCRLLSTGTCADSWAAARAYADENLVFDTSEEQCEWVCRMLAAGDVNAYTKALRFADKCLGHSSNQEDAEWAFRFLASGGNLEVWVLAVEYATEHLDLASLEDRYEWVFRFVASGRSLESWKTALRSAMRLDFATAEDRREWVFLFFDSGRPLHGPGSFSEAWRKALKFFADHRKLLGLKAQAKMHMWAHKMVTMEVSADVRKEASRLAMTHGGMKTPADVAEWVLQFVSSGTNAKVWIEALSFASNLQFPTAQDSSLWVRTMLSSVTMLERNAVHDSECVICLEPLVMDTQKLACSHLFHRVCFARWRTTHPDDLHCPSCRAPVFS